MTFFDTLNIEEILLLWNSFVFLRSHDDFLTTCHVFFFDCAFTATSRQKMSQLAKGNHPCTYFRLVEYDRNLSQLDEGYDGIVQDASPNLLHCTCILVSACLGQAIHTDEHFSCVCDGFMFQSPTSTNQTTLTGNIPPLMISPGLDWGVG